MSEKGSLSKEDEQRTTPSIENESSGNEAGDESSVITERTPLTLTIPGQNGEAYGRTGNPLTPLTPAEKVRTILSSDREDNVSMEDELQLEHALFCQMDVLCHFETGESGWKESARWLKYEERLDPSDRWSKPHVTTTSVHFLNNVKSGLQDGIVMLNIEAPPAVEKITEAVANDKHFDVETRKKFLDVLLKPHKHKHRKGMKKTKTGSSEGPLLDETNTNNQKLSLMNGSTAKASKMSNFKQMLNTAKTPLPQTADEISALYHTYPGGLKPETLKPYKPNKRFMKKIPGGSEAANILVGQVDFLQEPVVVFARLENSAVLADLTEVSIPTKLIFLVLGPRGSTSIWEYEEIGRAAAALLSDKIFCEVAYKASNRQDLLDGVDEFLDDLTVLPPSVWDPTTRLSPPDKTIPDEKIKRRLEATRHGSAPLALSAGSETDPTLERTGRLFGGLIADVKRRYPYMLSDYKDGLHVQCLASTIFIFFACITPIVTFGGLMGHATDGYMGTMETLLSGTLCGIVYHAFAGQPLTIIGATGPLLVFESIIYHTCHDYHIDFLAFRFWVGIWISVLLLIMVMFDLSYLVQYITRFTEESFAVLISLIFIVEAVNKLGEIAETHPVHTNVLGEPDTYRCYCEYPANDTDSVVTLLNVTKLAQPYTLINDTMTYSVNETVYDLQNWASELGEYCITYQNRIEVRSECITEKQCSSNGWVLTGDACHVASVTSAVPDVFLLSCVLCVSTFAIAYTFRLFRTSPFFPSIVRSTVSDFAVLIGIVVCTGIDIAMNLDTPKLLVPSEFKTTRPDRGWIVNPMAFGSRWYVLFLGIIPAFLAVILVFLDQQITSVIVNRKEHKLVKGHGYHLDLLVLTILIGICSLLGLPFFVAATVRSITHVGSLQRQSEIRAPGERAQFLGVREQRLTGVCVHLLIGLSVFSTKILQHIPMPVLYGVFLYMGITSLGGVQFVDRILIMFMPKKFQPDHIYLRHVRTKRIHMFTALQIFGMAIMWLFKSFKKISIIFPLMILALCFIRRLMDVVFTQNEMYWLDHLLPDAQMRKMEDESSDVELASMNGDTKKKTPVVQERIPIPDGSTHKLMT